MGKLDDPRIRKRYCPRMTPTVAKSEDDDCSSISSQATSSGNHSRLGRKGDPRMHRAVAARLASPKLTLIEALRLGGFDYPHDVHDDHYILPGDTVSLGQRKNQLSRRCRLAKQQVHGNNGAVKKEGTKRKRKASASRKHTEEAEQLMAMEQPEDYPEETSGAKRELTLSEEDVMDEGDERANARQRMAKYHPQYHPIIVPPAHSTLESVSNHTLQTPLADIPPTDILSAPAVHATQTAIADALRGPVSGPTAAGAQSLLNHSTANHSSLPHPSGVAVASLNATASSVGLTLEQLAISLSSTTNLARVLADQTIPDIKQELALNLFRAECSTLYQRCMLLAGYNVEDTQDTSLPYKEFAYKAWSGEGQRLEKQVGRRDPEQQSPETELAVATFEDGGVVAANESHSHGHAAKSGSNEKRDHDCNEEEKACFDGRHVHRLEGKCGHKAIIHHPDGAPAHIDFVVNGKVECYAGIKPVGNTSALWPSRYNCEELDCPDCPTDSSQHKVK